MSDLWAGSASRETGVERIDAEEKRNAFSELAEQRYDTILKTGTAIPWSEMRGYLEARARGESSRLPRARKNQREAGYHEPS